MNKTLDSTYLLVENQKQSQKGNTLKEFFFVWIYPLISIGKSRSLTVSITKFLLGKNEQLQLVLYLINILQLVNINLCLLIKSFLIKNINIQINFLLIYELFPKQKNCFTFLLWYLVQNFNPKYTNQLALKKSLFQAFACQIIVSFILFFIVSVATLGTPKLIQIGQRYFFYDNIDDKPSFNSLLIFVSIFVSYLLILSLFKPYYLYLQTIISVRIQGALQLEIIKKTLKMPLIRSQHYSIGELINMLQVDITQSSQYFQNAYQIFTLPLQLMIAGVVFVITLRQDAVLPIFGAVLQGILGITFGYFYGKIQNKFMLAKDLRMKMVDETLVYSKQIKLNCLENYFEDRISQKRQKELKYLKVQVFMLILLKFFDQLVQVLTWEIWFITAATMNFSKLGIMIQNYAVVVALLQNLPNQIRLYTMSSNSLSRLSLFLQQKEIQQNEIEYKESNQDDILVIQEATFDWKCNDTYSVENQDEDINEESQEVFSIKNLSLNIKKGKFVAIVGNSASGKSTLLRSILRETNLISGNLDVKGTISVATQEPWIINGSIRENITFMTNFDADRYKKVIKVCGLEKDILQFKYGDDTILGEKGDNLSGGQQKRINLARTIYRDVDIYLLDDPLSALDIKVRYHIHQQCLLGFLKDKTVILFTNSLQNLQEADTIYIIEQGQIIKQGNFNQIKSGDQEQQKIAEQKQFIDLKFEEDHYSKEEQIEFKELKASLLQIEDQQQGSINKQVIDQIFTYQGRYISILVAILYFLIIAACQIYGNSKLAQNNISDYEFRKLALTMYPLIMLPASICVCSMNAYFLIRGLKTSKIIHNNVISNLLKASFTKFYNTILIGRLMNRLSKDIYNIDMQFPNEMQNLTDQTTLLLLPLISSIIFLNYLVLPILFLFFTSMIYLTIIYYRSLREVTRIESVSKSPVFSFYQQIARGITFVRTAIKPELINNKHAKNVDLDLGNQICLYGMQYWFQSLAGCITSILQALLFIICYWFPGSTQKMTFFVLIQMQNVSQILLALAVAYGNVLMYAVSFERCLHLANNIETENYEKPTVTSTETPQGTREAISMKGCSFQYRANSKLVLQNLDFELFHGEKIGVVGRTGAGKSSFILALTEMIEKTQGELTIDGKPIQQYGLHDLRSKFSIIPQDPLIFMGSLRENLDPQKLYQDRKIREVCEICELFKLDSFKDNDLKSEIAISGNNLSLGEKQLVCIARCLLEQKLIILIDEATASIDGPTEEKIKEIFDKHFRESAMFTIAHKVTTIMGADRIMVMNDGQITELDAPQTLLANPNSEFKQIIDLITGAEQL